MSISKYNFILSSSFPFYIGKVESTEAFTMLLDEREGTYLLRETSQKELRFSVRSTIAKEVHGQPSDEVKLVGHIRLTKDDETGFGWRTGGGKHNRYDNFYEIIKANKEKDSIYQFQSHYKY